MILPHPDSICMKWWHQLQSPNFSEPVLNKDVLIDALTKLKVHQLPPQCTLEVHITTLDTRIRKSLIENLDDCHLVVNVEDRRIVLHHGQLEVAEHDLVGDCLL